MPLELITTVVPVGLMVGGLAGVVMKGRGYGLPFDFLLGLMGSFAGSWLFRALTAAPEAGWFATAAAAFAGAALVLMAQRIFWSADDESLFGKPRPSQKVG